MKKLPPHGSSLVEVMAQLRALQVNDADYHNARTWVLIYNAGPDVDELLHAAANETLLENALNPFVFPSLREMQRDVVSIAADLFHAGDDCGGSMSSGGTESIFLAVKTARDRARAERNIRHGRVIVPRTAHPAFHKACHLLDVEWVQMPLGEDLRTHAEELPAMITAETILCVGSAPNYPFGMVDPIPAMAAIASERGIPFHVDACLGGFILPFNERAGYAVPPWDFRVPGVTSISADVHKYGYAMKGASVIIHRPKAPARYQYYQFSDWPGGAYATQGFLGTKPAAPIAAAWAVMHFLGEDGYVRLAREVMSATDKLRSGVASIEGLHIWGEPDACILALGSDRFDIHAVSDVMNQRGWHFDRQDDPPAMHLTASARHHVVIDEFLDDLRYAVAYNAGASTTAATYGDVITPEMKS